MRRTHFQGLAAVWLLTLALHAGLKAEIKLAAPTLLGYTSCEAGQIVKGYLYQDGRETAHGWVQKATIGLGLDQKVSDHLRIVLGAEGNLAFSYKTYFTFVDRLRNTQIPHMEFSIHRGEGIFSFGDSSRASLQGEVGFFPYRTSPDVRNLGEFLFRSMVNPIFLNNRFDQPYTDMFGLRIGNILRGNFHQDLLLNSVVYEFPLQDYSLSYVLGYDKPKVFSVGGGISAYRLFSVNDLFTDPKFSTTIKKLENPDSVFDANGRFTGMRYDTTYYSFRGLKYMARLAFNPQGLLKIPIMGDEDMKIYAEAALIGWDPEDTLYYTDIFERLPIAVGFNFPTFKALDVLALEVEYWASPFPNSYSRPFDAAQPIPYAAGESPERLQWSIYAKRSIGKHCWIVAQFARDHFIPVTHSLMDQDKTDIMSKKGSWWWVGKVKFAL